MCASPHLTTFSLTTPLTQQPNVLYEIAKRALIPRNLALQPTARATSNAIALPQRRSVILRLLVTSARGANCGFFSPLGSRPKILASERCSW